MLALKHIVLVDIVLLLILLLRLQNLDYLRIILHLRIVLVPVVVLLVSIAYETHHRFGRREDLILEILARLLYRVHFVVHRKNV